MDHPRTRPVPARAAVPLTLGAALLFAVAVHGCTDIVAQPLAYTPAGAIGDPCYPIDETNAAFPGFEVGETSIEDQFSACQSGTCLAYHFQGRVDCPLGQPAPSPCQGPGDTSCGPGGTCAAADEISAACDPDGGVAACLGGACDPATGTCTCATDAECPPGAACDPGSHRCAHFVCASGAGCQSAGASPAENAGKSCCADGSGTPVSLPVCGQCAPSSPRAATNAVYCSCRCGLAHGDPGDPGNLCACPDGFACSEIVPYIPGLPNPYSGQYCIKAGTAYALDGGADSCGQVQGFDDASMCSGN